MTDYDFTQPAWITETLSPNTIAAVNQGGCESGAYMPACRYGEAADTMAEHGDDVLQYLEDYTGQLPTPPADLSWSQMACFYLSRAVETFCACHEHLADWDDDSAIAGGAA